MTVQYAITAGPTALAAATAKTIIEVTTTANVPCEWIAADIMFDGTNPAVAPVRVDLCTYTGTGTGSAYTPKRMGQAVGTSQSSVKVNDTAEPAGAVILQSWFINPTSGLWYQWPLGRELFHNVSTVQGIRLTSPVAVNALVNLSIEE